MKRKGICLLAVVLLIGGIYSCRAETSSEEAILED